MSAEQELLGIVREIELVEEDIRDRNRAKSDIYKEAAAKGYDKKTIRKVVAARRLDPFERDEQDNLFDTYMQAVERAEKGLTHAHVENIEEFDAETGEILDTNPRLAKQVIDGMQTETGRAALIAAVDIMIEREEAEEEFQAKASGEQTERTNGHDEGAGSRREMRVGEAGRDYQPATSDDGRDSVERHASNSPSEDDAFVEVKGSARLADANGVEPSSSVPIASASQGEAEAPSAERASELGMVELHLKYKPNCLRPEACGSSYIDRHCHSCMKAAAITEDA